MPPTFKVQGGEVDDDEVVVTSPVSAMAGRLTSGIPANVTFPINPKARPVRTGVFHTTVAVLERIVPAGLLTDACTTSVPVPEVVKLS
jgi:hypothetical protein